MERHFRPELLWRRPDYGGLVGALLLFCLSLFPSLLPRPILLHGAASGVALAVGYGLGTGASWLLRLVVPRASRNGVGRTAWWVLAGLAVVSVPLFLVLASRWEGTVRALVAIQGPPGWLWAAVPAIAVLLAGLFLALARLLRILVPAGLALVGRLLPAEPPLARRAGQTALVVAIVIPSVTLDPLGGALRQAFSLSNGRTSPGIEQPADSGRSGSPDSLVPWESLGLKGRDFVASGPSARDITAFTGRPAEEPIRVYVGVESAETLRGRVDLVLAELDRTGAWERQVLAVFTATGTGWVDEQAAQPLEYLHAGDTALVALQYSYLPSWLSFNLEPGRAALTSTTVLAAVHGRWSRLPEHSRPQLLLFGESLGSLGAESAFSGIDELLARTDGALFVGPVSGSPIHSQLTADREPGSPSWRPVYDGGRHVRFSVCPADLSQPPTPWSTTRVVYLQNASDPISYWEPQLLWRRPDWLEEPRGPDVTPDLQWLPLVTFWQLTIDMTYSTRGVPAGHGHVYGPNLVDSWAAVYPPQDWTDEDIEALRELVVQAEKRPLPRQVAEAPAALASDCLPEVEAGAAEPAAPSARAAARSRPTADGQVAARSSPHSGSR